MVSKSGSWQRWNNPVVFCKAYEMQRDWECLLVNHRLISFTCRSALKELARSASSPSQRRLTAAKTAVHGTVTPKTWTSSCLSIAHLSVTLVTLPGSPSGIAESFMLRTASLRQLDQTAALVLQGASRSRISAQMH